jgi:hypothetical protein
MFPTIKRVKKVDRSVIGCQLRKLQVKSDAMRDLERVRRRAQNRARQMMDERLKTLDTLEIKRERKMKAASNVSSLSKDFLRRNERNRIALMEQAGLIERSHTIPKRKTRKKKLKPIGRTRTQILAEKRKKELEKQRLERERKLAKIEKNKKMQKEKYTAIYREKKKKRDLLKREKERKEKEEKEREKQTQQERLTKQRDLERRQRNKRARKKREEKENQRQCREAEEAEIDREFQEWMAQRRKQQGEQRLQIEHATFLGSMLEEKRTIDPLDTELSEERTLATKMAEDLGIAVSTFDDRDDGDDDSNNISIPKRWRACFRMVDDDGDGKIDANEMWELFVMRGHEIDKKTVCGLLSIADRDGDGRVTYSEFCAIKEGMFQDDNEGVSKEEVEEYGNGGALTLLEDEEKLAVSNEDGDDDDDENSVLSTLDQAK